MSEHTMIPTNNYNTSSLINNRYRIIKELGEGGMGKVYHVEDLSNQNNNVALKLIKKKLINEENLLLFKQEFEIMSRLKHPNLIRVYDFGYDHTKHDYYITMEYLNGKSLKTLTKTQGKFPGNKVLSIMIACCRALTFIHSRKILHRDINLSNIILCPASTPAGFTVKLMDFGLSDLLDTEHQQLKLTKSKGTLEYMAPEVLKKKAEMTTDIFSLGITFFELITDSAYYKNFSTGRIISVLLNSRTFMEHKKQSLAALSDHRLYPIIDRMTEFNTDKRYHSCSDIITDINKATDNSFPIETLETKMAYVLGAGFTGREKEMQELKDHLTTPPEQCRAFLLKGEAGIGKSRLFYEFKKYCRINNIPFIETNCIEDKYLSPFIHIIGELLLKAHEKKIAYYGPHFKHLLKYHRTLSTIEAAPLQDPKTEQLLIMKNIVNFIIDTTNTDNRLKVLYINDLHCIDDASLKSLNRLFKNMNRSPNLRIYLSGRPHGLENKPLPDTIKTTRLYGFNEANVKTYIKATFGDNNLGTLLEKNLPLINKKVGGNPFYLQELMKSMVENGDIVFTRNCCELVRPLEQINIPPTLESLLLNRLTRLNLDSQKQHLLHGLILFNREITYAELFQIFDIDLDAVKYLIDQEILTTTMSESRVLYKPAHDLIKESVNRHIPDKQSLHALIAEGLEKVHAKHHDVYVEELAHHYYHACNREKARYYLEKASARARENYEVRKVISLYDKLLELVPENEIEQRIDIFHDKGLLLEIINEYEQSCAMFDNAISLAKSINDKDREGWALIRLSFALHRIKDRKHEEHENNMAALKLFTTTNNKTGLIATYLNLGYYHSFLDYNKALNYFTEGLKIIDEIDEIYWTAGLYGNLALLYYNLGDFEKALYYENKSKEHSKAMNYKRNHAIGYCNRGLYHFHLDNYDTALAFYEKSEVLGREIEYDTIVLFSLLDRAMIYLSRNNIADAKKCHTKAACLINKDKDYDTYRFFRFIEAKIMHANGDTDEAVHILVEIINDYGSIIPDWSEAYYELWKMTGEETYRQKSLHILQDKLTKTPHFTFKNMIAEMEDFL